MFSAIVIFILHFLSILILAKELDKALDKKLLEELDKQKGFKHETNA